MSKEIIVPRPVNGPYYDGWTLDKWVLKVAEETGEAITAAKHFQKASKLLMDAKHFQKASKLLMDAKRMLKKDEHAQPTTDTMQVGVTAARDELCSELTDVITAATSVLEYVGCNFDERQRYQRKINESNAKRDGGRRFRKDDDA